MRHFHSLKIANYAEPVCIMADVDFVSENARRKNLGHIPVGVDVDQQ